MKENGGEEKQFFASQTSQVPVSGGKGWQIYASVFSKTKNLDAKTKNQRKKPAYQNTGNRDFGGKSSDSEVRQTSTTALNRTVVGKTKRVFGPSCISDFPNTPLKILKEIRI